MSDNEKAGCALFLVGTLRLLIVSPLWYVLLYSLLARAEAEPWQWVLFWVYVPFGLLLGLTTEALLGLVRATTK